MMTEENGPAETATGTGTAAKGAAPDTPAATAGEAVTKDGTATDSVADVAVASEVSPAGIRTGKRTPQATPPETVPETPAAPLASAPGSASRTRPRRGAAAPFLAALAGGALAAVLGFGLAYYDVFGLRPPTPPDSTAELAALDARIDGLAAGIAEARETAGAALDAANAEKDGQPLAPLVVRLDALEASVANLHEGTADVAQVADPGAVRALIREELDARDEAESAADEATARVAQAAAQHSAALQTLKDALASGTPYAAALETLAPGDAPPALARHAESGLPTLATLKAGFPEAARSALTLSLHDGTDKGGIGALIWAFLRIESGARSLTPREGDDPDAILSRAEAMVEADDLASALGELATLPPAGREAMATWMAAARDRLDAEAALSALAMPPVTPAAP